MRVYSNQNQDKKIKRKLATLILCASFLSMGCTRLQADDSMLSQETEAIEESLTQAEIESIREEFRLFCDEIFIESMKESALYTYFVLKDPGAYGITSYESDYGEFGLVYLQEENEKAKTHLETLENFREEALTPEQQITKQILKETFERSIATIGYELYYEPLAPTIGIQAQLPILLCEYTFEDREDIEDYLRILAGIDTYYQSIMDFEEQKSQAGLFMSDITADAVIASCNTYLLVPEDNFMVDSFKERLENVVLTEEEKAAYIDENNRILEEDFTNGYDIIKDGLEALKGSGTNAGGLCYFSQTYAEQFIREKTQTSYESLDMLRADIEEQLNRDFTMISTLITDGVDFNTVSTYQFFTNTPRAILSYLEKHTEGIYPEVGELSYEIKSVPDGLGEALSPAFYLTPCIDDTMSNIIYINTARLEDTQLFTILAHEGIAGHMYQNAYFQALEIHPLRHILTNSAYVEGWATYVEYQSYFLDENISEEEAHLLAANEAASLGLYAYLDLDINYFGALEEDVGAYLAKYYDISDAEVVKELYNTLVENPGNALMYYVGYLEITQMKEEAQVILGEDFDVVAFHTFLLDIGPASFDIIRNEFSVWLGTLAIQ